MNVSLAHTANVSKESAKIGITDMVNVEYEGYSLKVNPFFESEDTISSEISLNDRKNYPDSKSEFQEICDVNLCSSATYKSLYDGLDLNVIISSSNVSEEVVLDKQSKIPETVQYFIEADGLKGRYS